MAAAWRIALHDLRLTLTDRAAVVWLFLLPVVFATFFGLVMGGGSDPRAARAALSVDDRDGGPVATALLTALEGEGLALSTEAGEEPPLRLLRIPAETTRRVLAGEQVELRLEIDPDASPEASLLVQARLTAAVARVIGRLVEVRRTDPDAPVDGSQLATASPETDLVTVASTWAGRARTPPSGFSQSVPGNVVMFVLLVALTYGAASLTGERTSGLLRRLATTPVSRAQIVVGKIGGRLCIAGLQVTVLVAVAVAAQSIVDLDLGDPLAVWLVLLVYTLAIAPLGVAIGGWFREPDRAASIGVIATMVMAAMGGCWWPLEVVPKALQTVALLFPTGWAMTALHGIISFGQGLGEVTTALVALLAFGAGFSLLAARSLRLE